MQERPLIRRSLYFDHFPQVPDWFNTKPHLLAKRRYLKKYRTQYKMEELTHCPLCNGQDFRLLANQERHGCPISVVICLSCSFIFNQTRLDRSSMEDHYRTDARAIERGEREDLHPFMFRLQSNKGPAILEFLKQSFGFLSQPPQIKTVAEVGCGEGGLLSQLAPHFGKGVGFELNPLAVEYGQSRGLDVRAASFDRTPEHFDLVVYEQVLEHIQDLAAELKSLASVQKVDDFLYVGVPGLWDFPKAYDHNFLSYLEYQHLYHFTLSTLERLLSRYGYRLVHGNEKVRALFIRSDDKVSLTTPAQSPDEIFAFFKFRRRNLQKTKTPAQARD